MTLSVAAITGPVSASPTRTTASMSVFALSLAQVAGAPVAGTDDDPPPVAADTPSKDDTRQDDAAGGNALPLAPTTPADPSLLVAWLAPPAAVTPAPVPVVTAPMPVATVTAPMTAAAAAATIPAGMATTAATTTTAMTLPPPVSQPVDPSVTAKIEIAQPATSPMVAALLPDPAKLAVVPKTDGRVAPTPPPPITAPALAAAFSTPVPAATGPVPVPLATAASAIVALAAPVSPTGVTITAVQAPTATDTPAPSVADPTPAASATRIDTRAAPVVALQPAQASTPIVSGVAPTTTSAIQAFGTAMREGLKDARTEPTDATPAIAGTTTHAAALPAVDATSEAQQAPLDLRRENWPHAMIDRIEALRDAADATSTRMRVVPDALGPIEMSVRKDGDTVHVHFAADQPQTRQMLADAQPRLAQIAEQRGLRLGGSTVDAGAGGAGQQQQQATTQQPVAPPSPTVTADTAADDHTRLA